MPARIPAGVGTVLRYWSAERRTLRHGFTALVVSSMGDLAAGLTLGSITGTLERLPGLLVLVPAAIGMRGNIFGALGSRLGTSIHVGVFEPTRRRSGVLGQNVIASGVLTLVVSAILAILARVASEAFGVPSISVWDLLVISVVGGVLSSLVVGTFTVGIAIASHRRSWDLDSVAAPLVTAAGDVATVPALFAASFLVGLRWVTPVIAAACLLASVSALAWSAVAALPIARRIVLESLPVLVAAGSVDVLAGLLIEGRVEHFLRYPALLVLIPPFLEDAGALGGILSARLSSRLHLGILRPRGWPESRAVLDFTIIGLFALWVFPLVGISADVVSGIFGLASPGALTVVGITLFGGLLATAFAIAVAYYAAVATMRLGLDPDNHGLPIITSSMDFLGVLCLVAALRVFGVA
jgi:mgtE-like transporter